MAYIDDEQSVDDGNVVELYKFSGALGNYFLTSASTDIVDGSLQTWLTTAMKRQRVKKTSKIKATPMTVQMDIDTQLVRDYAFGIPPRGLVLELFRQHNAGGAPILYWAGPVTSIDIEGRIAKLTVPSTASHLFNTQIPSVYYQNLCNHVLYDARCGVNSGGFSVGTIVDAVISGTQISVVSDGGNADDFFKAGEMANNVTGESRMIVGHAGNTMVLAYPFKTISSGQSLTLLAGCTHRRTGAGGCIDKFNNVENYGGEDWIPNTNIFATGF